MKLAAMQAVGDVKDMVHDTTTKLPDAVQTDYAKLDRQSIGTPRQQAGLEYMHNGLLGFDAIEEELRTMAMQSMLPQPEQLIGLATRIDGLQRQVFNGLQELRNLSVHIDQATDKLQNNNVGGWSQPTVKNQWNK